MSYIEREREMNKHSRWLKRLGRCLIIVSSLPSHYQSVLVVVKTVAAKMTLLEFIGAQLGNVVILKVTGTGLWSRFHWSAPLFQHH